MEEIIAVQGLINIFHQLDTESINLFNATKQAYKIFRIMENDQNEQKFSTIFLVAAEYFFNPAKKSSEIIIERKISKKDLILANDYIKNSKLMKRIFLSNYYPRPLLIKSAAGLLEFIKTNPKYLHKILEEKLVCPLILEIHPTNAQCTYRCRMCIWCGGQDPKKGLLKSEEKNLLIVNDWKNILNEAKSLGTQQIILSGGGETLLAQNKIKPVLDKANALGFKTIIYSNGRTLHEMEPLLINSILDSTWLRISLHTATPETYAKITNQPVGSNDLEFVVNGIKRVIKLRNNRRKKLKVGIGLVLQELNCAEIPNIIKLCSSLKVDFLDLRVDCIGITKKLTEDQVKKMLSDLKNIRNAAENKQISFDVSFADDLLIMMDQWKKTQLTQPKRCLIPLVRPAIDPYGIVGACASIGEPFTRSKSPQEYILGRVGNNYSSFTDIMRSVAGKKLDIRCKFCMPGQISLNALLEKFIDDLKIGIYPEFQPFCFGGN